ncbi:adenosylcobinamide-phosphate synthase CbiB [Ghiorsea bivora]|uniref:adenosylcobinamide-phosphate synthase CbiB n=1 Tax=Ghiorsea bivora TaxID=1485545 RepID=UPI000690440E|nr:adenosylcobinamide-phosphate synthase CbiB [Ghiorsea bivora]
MFFDHVFWTLSLALAFEYIWGDPKSNWHPVATLGNFAEQIEKLLWKNSRFSGFLAWFLVFFGSLSIFITLWYHLAYDHAWLSVIFEALLFWFSLGWKSLIEHTQSITSANNIEEAKAKVSMVVGRNTDQMNQQDIHKASIESLAENTSDAIIAPLFWFILLGAWGAWAYRIINTLDAMWGYKNEKYTYFGWFAAKIDDIANFFPARITALLMLLQQPRLLNKIPSIYHQAKQHLSPNAGFPETAMAFLLGIRLGGDVVRDTGIEHRAYMGDNPQSITTTHIQQAIHISNRCVYTMLGLTYTGILYTSFMHML